MQKQAYKVVVGALPGMTTYQHLFDLNQAHRGRIKDVNYIVLRRAILAKDIPLVQALVVYMTAIYIFLNLIVDFTYGIIDPRIRLERKK